jgi:hypothetical protein
MGAYSLALAERGVALAHASESVAGATLPLHLKVSCNRFGVWHTVTYLLSAGSKRLVECRFQALGSAGSKRLD